MLVSNTGQADSPELSTVNVNALAQGFTTGRRAAGYNLSSIELDFGQAPEPSSKLTVALWSASGSTPNALLHTLTELATISTGLVAFAPPVNTVLDPGTTYFVVARYSGGGIPPSLRRTASDDEDRGTRDRGQLERGRYTPDSCAYIFRLVEQCELK